MSDQEAKAGFAQAVAAEKNVAGTKDIGAHMFTEATAYESEEMEHEKLLVKKKLDRILLPRLMLSFTLQFLDKLSLNYGSAYTFISDLNLVGNQYSTVAAAYNYGMIVWNIPANYLLQRYPVAKYTGIMIIFWGILLLCAAGTQNFGGIFTIRFILGMAESNMTPAYMMITSMFYKRDEQPFRLCLYVSMNGVATMLGALFAYGLGHVENSSVASWRLIFITIGGLNFVWGFLFLYLVPDTPMTARWLTHKERVLAVSRVSENMMGVKDGVFKVYQVKEAIVDPKLWIMLLLGFALGIISGGLGNFLTALTKGFGFTGLNATLLQLPTGALELVVLPIGGWMASRYKDSRCIVLAVFSLIPLSGFLGIRFTSLDAKWSLVGSSWLLYTSALATVLCYNLLATNFAGHTKRATVNALWFISWSVGSIAGTYFFFPQEAPRYFSAITALCICMGGTIVLAIVFRQYMWWENRKRVQEIGADGRVDGDADDEAIRLGFLDKTDRENKHFRYGL